MLAGRKDGQRNVEPVIGGARPIEQGCRERHGLVEACQVPGVRVSFYSIIPVCRRNDTRCVGHS